MTSEQDLTDRVTEFKSKYALSDFVLFYDYTPEECGLVRSGEKINRKPIKGWILAVTFDLGNPPMYHIQDEEGFFVNTGVSEEHIVKILEEDE
jgi:hypothetical protein